MEGSASLMNMNRVGDYFSRGSYLTANWRALREIPLRLHFHFYLWKYSDKHSWMLTSSGHFFLYGIDPSINYLSYSASRSCKFCLALVTRLVMCQVMRFLGQKVLPIALESIFKAWMQMMRHSFVFQMNALLLSCFVQKCAWDNKKEIDETTT